MSEKKIFSIDCEVDGLYGKSFAIAVTVRLNGEEVSQFQGRIPDEEVRDTWVRENVLPALKDMEVTHSSSEELEEAFWDFWMSQKEGSTVIAHCGSPVESGLFRRCVERKLDERQWSGPFPLHEVGTILYGIGSDPCSVDSYNKANGIEIPFAGVAHHPMYDAQSAAVAWEHAMKRVIQASC
ncbi:MAG TPA: hypothetical protein PKA63_14555 [Oligoflexia bacterium]|nr:hypothetical protein [Oligoflexia bacterium]HMP49887.1 hypothetical protein [Oligoflexia bacterium]